MAREFFNSVLKWIPYKCMFVGKNENKKNYMKNVINSSNLELFGIIM